MYQSRYSYKSLADYDYNRIMQQKRNVAQVEKVLTLYENNNQTLVDQVHDLIRENEILRKQVSQQPSMTKSKLQPYKPQYSISEAHEASEISSSVRSTIRKHNPTDGNSRLKISHPRDVYLPAQQAHEMNMKRLKEAKTAHKKYDQSREFQQFKEKLSEKKQQLRKSYKTKSVLIDGDLSLSRKVYIDRVEIETQPIQREKYERRPLESIKKNDTNTLKIDTNIDMVEKRDNSPYSNFKKQVTTYHSPAKLSGRNYQQPLKSAQRSSSAIKIESVCPESCFKIQEPKTKWGDLSSTYFQRSKWIQNDQNGLLSSKQFYQMEQSKTGKPRRKKFLNVVSQSALDEEKLKEKSSS